MKYKLKKDLPYMKAGTVFIAASSLCCGIGWAIPAKPKKCGQVADNPVTTFTSSHNKIIDEIIGDEDWIEAIPENNREKLDFYENGKWTKEHFLTHIS